MKFIVGLIIFLHIVCDPSPALAPTMVGDELTMIRALGYEVCEPTIGWIEAKSPDQLAEAYWHNECRINFVKTIQIENVSWVAWHEVCHLATMKQIVSLPDYKDAGEDWPHDHPLFKQCNGLGGFVY